MGDVAQILAGAAASAGPSSSAGGDLGGPFRRRTSGMVAEAGPSAAAAGGKGGAGKKKKLSREVSALLGDQPQEVLPMMVRAEEEEEKESHGLRARARNC